MQVIDNSDNNNDLINKNFQHLRYNYTFKDSSFLTYELFTQRQQNKLKYLEFRAHAGTGFRFRLLNNDFITLYISPLLMYEYERLDDDNQTITSLFKGDFYTSFSININKIIGLSHVTYYQPVLYEFYSTSDLEQFKDFRISTETSLDFSIIKNKLAFSIIYEMTYDSNPPAELVANPLFYTLNNQLTFNF